VSPVCSYGRLIADHPIGARRVGRLQTAALQSGALQLIENAAQRLHRRRVQLVRGNRSTVVENQLHRMAVQLRAHAVADAAAVYDLQPVDRAAVDGDVHVAGINIVAGIAGPSVGAHDCLLHLPAVEREVHAVDDGVGNRSLRSAGAQIDDVEAAAVHGDLLLLRIVVEVGFPGPLIPADDPGDGALNSHSRPDVQRVPVAQERIPAGAQSDAVQRQGSVDADVPGQHQAGCGVISLDAHRLRMGRQMRRYGGDADDAHRSFAALGLIQQLYGFADGFQRRLRRLSVRRVRAAVRYIQHRSRVRSLCIDRPRQRTNRYGQTKEKRCKLFHFHNAYLFFF